MKGNIALKLDITKAYNRVSWSFLRAIMIKPGFDTQWVNRMMMCMSTVEYFVLMIQEVGPIKPGRASAKGMICLHTCT